MYYYYNLFIIIFLWSTLLFHFLIYLGLLIFKNKYDLFIFRESGNFGNPVNSRIFVMFHAILVVKINIVSLINFSISKTDSKNVRNAKHTMRHLFYKKFNLSRGLNVVTCVSLKNITEINLLQQFKKNLFSGGKNVMIGRIFFKF